MAELKLGKCRFVCVEYPAIVQDEEKMLATLGGEKKITKDYLSMTQKHIELRWRPNDFYCKAVYGEKHSTTNLVMKVKRRRRKRRNSDGIITEEVEYHTEILGVVEHTYKFDGMADFQYLQAQRQADGTYRSLTEDLLQNDNVLPSHTSLMKTDIPLFIPPIVFSRFHVPINYIYRPDKTKSLPPSRAVLKRAGINRKKRENRNIFVAFGGPVPTKPLKLAMLECAPLASDESLQIIKKEFDERPVWTKYALICLHPEMNENRIKHILPLVAYFVTSGPWKNLWVRLGYDVMKSPESKKYQVMDFRMTCLISKGLAGEDPITNKRPMIRRAWPAHRVAVHKKPCLHISKPQSQEPKDDSWKFFPGVLPPHKMMLYMLCDIKVDAVEKIVHSNDGEETECTITDGWCVKNHVPQIIKIMKKLTFQTLKSQGYEGMSRHDGQSDESDLDEADTELMDYMVDEDT